MILNILENLITVFGKSKILNILEKRLNILVN